jgi:ribonuclease R
VIASGEAPARRDADEGLIEGKRKRLLRAGDLPSVPVLSVDAISDDGEPVGVPIDWDPDAGVPPRITIATRSGGRRSGDASQVWRQGARPPHAGTGERRFTARVIKLLERPPKRPLVSIARWGVGRVVPSIAAARNSWSFPVRPGEPRWRTGSVEINKAGRHGLASGRVLDRIGDVSTEKAISLIALQEHGIPYIFPRAVLEEADPPSRPICLTGRLAKATADHHRPADARDHDDAVFAEPDPEGEGGFVVTVAIADVAIMSVRSGARS